MSVKCHTSATGRVPPTFSFDEIVEAGIAALVTVDQGFDQAFAARLHDELVEGLSYEMVSISASMDHTS